MKEHKNHTKTFNELNYNEQSKSITAQIINLSRQIEVHMATSSDPNATRLKCIAQLSRMIAKLAKI